jgi:hypothetical protein
LLFLQERACSGCQDAKHRPELKCLVQLFPSVSPVSGVTCFLCKLQRGAPDESITAGRKTLRGAPTALGGRAGMVLDVRLGHPDVNRNQIAVPAELDTLTGYRVIGCPILLTYSAWPAAIFELRVVKRWWC